MNQLAPTPTTAKKIEFGGYASIAEVLSRLRIVRRRVLTPKPRLSVSQWANQNAYLSAETSSSVGQFRSFKYQDEIMDSAADPLVRQLVVKKSSRVGYTRCLDNIVGYYIDQDPSPILLVQPTVEDAEGYSEEEIAPMIRDTKALRRHMIGGVKARDPSQKILRRRFSNGASIKFVGANSPRGFRRVTVRIVGFDEVDGFPVGGAGDEGDQIKLGIKRTESYWNSLAILGSTPTKKGRSRISSAYELSDKRRYHVPCPQCGQMQALKWSNLRWDKAEDGSHQPETAHFVCEAQGCIIEEREKKWMIDNGAWIAAAPFRGIAGFHIWSAYSLFPKAAWANLVQDFLDVKHDPTQLQTFVNTTLGEEWEDKAETVDPSQLETRGENYGPQSIPDGVALLTSGVDVQGDRLEATTLGFGIKEETWAIEHVTIFGDPSERQVWDDLDLFLRRSYYSETGQELRIRAACVDMGGHHTNEVLVFCRNRRSRRIFAIMGRDGPRPIWPRLASRAGKQLGNGNEIFFNVGVSTAKDTIYGRLRIAKHGPGYQHFPVGDPFNAAYFKQLTIERVVTRYKEGKPYRIWEKPSGARNEALDCYAYALAARLALPYRLDGKEGPALPAPPPPTEGDTVEGSEEVQTPAPVVRSGYEAAEPPAPRASAPVRHSSFQDTRGSNWFRRR